MTQHLVGIDVGTSGAKVLIVDADTGATVIEHTTTYPLHLPRPLWAEQDPSDWIDGVTTSLHAVLKTVDAASIIGLGLTGQMHGLVMQDETGAVLRPAILWNDQRTAVECAALTDRIGADRVLELIGNPILPGFTAGKIAWIRAHEPDVFRHCDSILLPKDYVRWWLTGVHAIDVADASGTAFFDVAHRRWSAPMCAALDIPEDWLPPVHESTDIVGHLSEAGAAATGLPVGLPVVAGAGDQAAEAVGGGILDDGAVSATIGTSGVVFAASRQYRADPGGRLHAFAHAMPGRWHLMGVMLSAGGSLSWLAEVLGAEGDIESLLSAAAEVPAGSEGLTFLPYLTGERTPYADPNARGVFFGLTRRHGRAHLTRAVVEGVAYGLADSLVLMREAGIKPECIRVSGGGTRSPLWRQVLADVLGCTIETTMTSGGAAYGAALLAAAGVRATPVPDVCARWIRPGSRTEPGSDAATYAAGHAFYRSLYPTFRERFAAITPSSS